MRSLARSALVTIALTAACLACQDESARTSPDGAPADGQPPAEEIPPAPDLPVARAELAREEAPEVTADVLAAQVDGQRDFALDLLRAAGGEGTNALISPFSVHQALGMTFAGARGETHDAMATALRAGTDEAAFHRAANALDRALAQAPAGLPDEATAPVVRVANAVFAHDELPIEAPFLETLARNYGAGLWLVDFASAAEAARLAINQWVAAHTENHIPELLQPGQVGELTRMVLVNAVYLLADWARPFPAEGTYDRPFQAPAGERAVPFMHTLDDFAVAETDEAVTIELPYAGDTLSLLVVVPKGALADFERGLDSAGLRAIEEALAFETVDLALPRFEVRARFLLKDALTTMGMGAVFADDADFQGISREPLKISQVVHEAWMRVDEKGTEAAAATAVLLDAGGAPFEPEARAVVVDRPFLLLLRHRPTGAILFAGRVVNP